MHHLQTSPPYPGLIVSFIIRTCKFFRALLTSPPMEFLRLYFPVSGVTTWAFIPPVVAFTISLFTSMAGVSGAFLLLPYQMSALGFTGPSVTSTNFVYNIVAIPSGIYRYIKEKRMVWPLTMIIAAGTLPGVLLGYYLRILLLPDPSNFKAFVGCVLLALGVKLLHDGRNAWNRSRRGTAAPSDAFQISTKQQGYLKSGQLSRISYALPADAAVRTTVLSFRRIEYRFGEERYGFSVPSMFLLALAVGVIGGTYGIGGGAIIAPFCVAVFRLPVHTIAGAALFGTFLTSIAGVLFYTLLPGVPGMTTDPDWVLGGLFGLGGTAGMYLGARLQKYLSQNGIRIALGVLITSLSLRYLFSFITSFD